MKLLIIGNIVLTAVLLCVVMNLEPVMAWLQDKGNETHQAINREAVDRFLKTAAKSDKYKDSPIDTEKVYTGPQVKSCGNFMNTYHLDSTQALTFRDWLIHGGYSADEPHFFMAVKHFYNPVREVGPPELTDLSEIWGLGLQAVSARTWAFTSADNLFCWQNALACYKQAMEIPDDSAVTGVPGYGFQDENIPVGTPEAARNVYLAKAFRGLGETMHLMADMTQPAHVRNDAHPRSEPLEDSVNKSNVLLASYFQAEPEISKEIDSAASAEDVFDRVALFTNANFYSNDTIYDPDSKVFPNNGRSTFPAPSFNDLVLLEGATTPAGVKTAGLVYGKKFKNKYFEDSSFIPMIQQTYSSYILGTKKEYHVPCAFAPEQSAVLIPVAIKANAMLIDLFFPTMELKIEAEKLPAAGGAGTGFQEFQLKGRMEHLIRQDSEWKKYGMEIRYCGPAELRCLRNGQDTKLADIPFRNGALDKPLTVYTGDAKNTGSGDMQRYRVLNGDALYIVIKAGGRVFKSNDFKAVAADAPAPTPTPPPTPQPAPPPSPQPPSGTTDAPPTISANIGPDGQYWVTRGCCTSLYWSACDATRLTIEPGIGDVTSKSIKWVGAHGEACMSGKIAICPGETTTYTLAASAGKWSKTASTDITIIEPEVNPSVLPHINYFEASPRTIKPGESVILSWNATKADSAYIEGIGEVGASGRITVSPGSTTTYTIQASNSKGKSSKQRATVTVTEHPERY